MSHPPSVRRLDETEAATLIDWAAEEGWNPGLDDASPFFAADPQGFLGTFVGDVMAAGISAVAYGAEFGFIGLYICHPDFRGRGHAKAVWDAGMAHLSGRTVGLDGVPAQQVSYRKMGFETHYRTLRYSGVPLDLPDRVSGVRPLSPDLLPDVLEFDRSCFPEPREAFLRHWIAPPRLALGYVLEGRLQGYGVARQCGVGHKIGPLFARDAGVAQALFSALAAASGGDVHIDVPESCEAFIAFLAATGLSPGFETARMYRGRPPSLDHARIFGITTLELG